MAQKRPPKKGRGGFSVEWTVGTKVKVPAHLANGVPFGKRTPGGGGKRLRNGTILFLGRK